MGELDACALREQSAHLDMSCFDMLEMGRLDASTICEQPEYARYDMRFFDMLDMILVGELDDCPANLMSNCSKISFICFYIMIWFRCFGFIL